MDTLSDRLAPHLLSLLRIVAALITGRKSFSGFRRRQRPAIRSFFRFSGGKASSKSLAALFFFSDFSRTSSPSSSQATWPSPTGWSTRRKAPTLPSTAVTPQFSTASSSCTSRPRGADLGASTAFSNASEIMTVLAGPPGTLILAVFFRCGTEPHRGTPSCPT